jgi:DNA repair protein RecO (recombination protein O)
MDCSTNAIVLKAIKYGETSLIINIYTELSGLQTLIVKGVRTHSKKKLFTMGMFQNLNILKVNFTRKKQIGIGILKSAKVIHALSYQGA